MKTAALLAMSLASSFALAQPFHDDFNGTSLDPAWHISHAYLATGVWSGGVQNDALTVYTIEYSASDPCESSPYTEMAHLFFTRAIDAPDNFDFSARISWTQPIGTRNAGYVFLEAVDTNGATIATVGFYDAWARTGSAYGEKFATVGDVIHPGQSYGSGAGSLTANGSAVVGLARRGGHIYATWDGVTILTFESTVAVAAVQLRFIEWPTRCEGGPYPTTMWVDYVNATASCSADFNGDGFVDFFDYLDFVDAFSRGC